MAKKAANVDVGKLTASVVCCLLAGVIGSIFTYKEITGWYASLIKPSFSPPNWVFGPVWTILYILMGVALYLVWKENRKKQVRMALQVFAVQLGLNVLWSLLFFGLHSPLYGLVGIAALWLSIVATIYHFRKISKTAAWLLVPYILWVSFASILNYAVFMLNP